MTFIHSDLKYNKCINNKFTEAQSSGIYWGLNGCFKIEDGIHFWDRSIFNYLYLRLLADMTISHLYSGL